MDATLGAVGALNLDGGGYHGDDRRGEVSLSVLPRG
jgi:hypothetical protein